MVWPEGEDNFDRSSNACAQHRVPLPIVRVTQGAQVEWDFEINLRIWFLYCMDGWEMQGSDYQMTVIEGGASTRGNDKHKTQFKSLLPYMICTVGELLPVPDGKPER